MNLPEFNETVGICLRSRRSGVRASPGAPFSR